VKQSKLARGNGEVKHKTEDERKTKVQLIGELAEMRQQIVELEAHAKQIYPVMDESTREFIAISNQLKHNLAGRVKELRCLYGIATIAEKSKITLDELYQEVANLLPSSWQYPEICCTRITTEDKEFRTANYRDAKWKLCSDIKIGGVKVGAVEVNYLEKRPKLDEGPFSRDERRLIDAVAAQMGRITERKRAEEELVRLSSAVKMSTDSIVIGDLDGKIIDVNEATLKMYGTDDKRDLIEKNSFELIAPEEREKALAGMKKVLEKGYVTSREYHIVTKDGGRVPVEMSIAIMKDAGGKPIGFVGISRDITERKKAEEKLTESENKFRTIFENIGDIYYRVDLKGNLTLANPAAVKIMGYDSIEEVIGKNLAEDFYYYPEARKIFMEELKKHGEVKNLEVTLKRKDGTLVIVEVNSHFVHDATGKPIEVEGIAHNITERKEAEKRLQESEEKLRVMFGSITDGVIVTDLTGTVVEANDSAAHLVGYSNKEELIGRNAFEFVSPKDRALAMDATKKTLEERLVQERTEYTILTADGREIDTDSSATVLYDSSGNPVGIINVVRDITDRKRAEETLKESEEKSRTFIDTASDLMHITDRTGNITDVNESMARILGYSKEDLIGMHFTQILPLKTFERDFKPPFEKFIKRGGEIAFDTAFTTKDGKEVYGELRTVAIHDRRGRYAGSRVVFHDLTERKKAEEELQEKNEQLEAQREELVRKATELEMVNQAKSEFLASMSHELRTPLNAVIGFSELMLDGIPGEINDEQRGCVNDILDSGKHLLNLINDILDLSKVEAGKIELKLQNLNIANVVSGVVQIMKPVLDKNRQEIEISVMQGLPKVRGDKNRLEQILLNLLSNASKFTEQGGRVQIHVGREGDYCQVGVIDTGIGIKKEDQEHIFEAFIQGETLSDRKKEGTGLGLTLTKQFVEATGGRIWVESKYGKGSTFIFTIPLAGEPLETSLGDRQSSYS